MRTSFNPSYWLLQIGTAALLISTIGLLGFGTNAFAGTVITTNLPANTAIINIDARADGSANYNSDESLWYAPFNAGGQLPELTLQPGTYSFRLINPEDAAQLFPALTPAQTNQMYSGWTFNAPWATDYLVFDSAAATNKSLPQLFDAAFSNIKGGNTWQFYGTPDAAYAAAVSNHFASLLRTSATGGRDSTNDITAYTFAAATTLIFVIPDSGLSDNAGGVSVLVSPSQSGTALYIESVPPDAVRLLWPTNDPAFSLQSNTNLAGGSWLGAEPLPSVVGTNNVVTNSTSDGHRFYRLFKP